MTEKQILYIQDKKTIYCWKKKTSNALKCVALLEYSSAGHHKEDGTKEYHTGEH